MRERRGEREGGKELQAEEDDDLTYDDSWSRVYVNREEMASS